MSAGHLFPCEQSGESTDDVFTPRWIFESLGLKFDLDVAAPPGGLPWIPAARSYSMADDGLTAPWSGRVWMNPPYSNASPWVRRFINHAHGIALVGWAKSNWTCDLWASADALAIPPGLGSFKFANKSVWIPVYFAAFGRECCAALANVGVVRVRA
jgi:hypothetical protein